MPIYEYKCRNCGRVVEQIELSHATKPPCCSGCVPGVSITMDRVQFSKSTGPDGLAVFFRGSGFHVNDYPKEKK